MPCVSRCLNRSIVTRAHAPRQVIVYDDSDARIPMFEMLERRGLATAATLEDLAPRRDGESSVRRCPHAATICARVHRCAASPSVCLHWVLSSVQMDAEIRNSAAEWVERGQQFLNVEAYDEAAKCFRNGRLRRGPSAILSRSILYQKSI